MPRQRIILAVLAAVALLAPHVRAHGVDEYYEEPDLPDFTKQAAPPHPPEVWRTWGFEPGSVAGLALAAGLYGVGLARTWRRSGVGHGIKRWEAACFAAGWLALFVALVSPIHPLGAWLFWVHMTQHEILMLVAAPLLVLGRPTPVFLRALGRGAARRLGQFSNSPVWRSTWGVIRHPMAAWLVHAAVLWAWHVPALFQSTLHSEWAHAAQHTSFLATALLFWWSLLHAQGGPAAYGAGVAYLFTTAVHSGFLGALLTFADAPWYPDYARTAPAYGYTALEDQQIGGLVMWVPACTVYVGAGLFMVARWLAEAGRRAEAGRLGWRSGASPQAPPPV